jgi:hypothetical protein
LDEYNKARQNAAKYSAAFEGHKNIIAPSVIFVIVMFSSIYIAHS